MAPHLLSVSGEIRNMIYEYALTENGGVCYREDARGVGWLCTYQIGKDITSDIGLKEDDSDDELFDLDVFDEDEEAEGMREAGKIRPLESEVHEFVQPRESAPTEPEKLQGLVIVEPGSYIVTNQLQLVCKQLRNETRGLTLRCNTVTFAESGPGRSSELCTNFVQSLSTNQKSHVKTLVVKQIGGCFKSKFSLLIDFCVENPHVKIRLEDYNITYCPACIVAAAEIYKFVLRKRIPLFESMKTQFLAALRRFGSFEARMANLLPSHASPDNIRVFPRPEPFDEVEFRSRTMDHDILPICVTPGLERGIDSLVALGKDFVENGW
jgi:hypothetical protein